MCSMYSKDLIVVIASYAAPYDLPGQLLVPKSRMVGWTLVV